jgi:hypothetical protein
MSSSKPNESYIPKYPMMKGFTLKDAAVTRKQWDELVVRCPKAYGRVVANLLRDEGIEETKIQEVLEEIHQSSEKKKLPALPSSTAACLKNTKESSALTVASPIVVNLEESEDDDDDVPLALRASLSPSRKRKLDTPKNQEPSSSKRQQRIDSPTAPMNQVSEQIMVQFENLTDLMIKMFDEQNKRLDKLEEGLKILRRR